MKKSSYKIWGVAFAFVLLVIIGCYVILYNTISKDNSTEYSYDLTTSDTNGLSYSVVRSEPWHDGTKPMITYAQYDFLFENRGPYDFCEWTIELSSNKEIELSSGWNGEYYVVDEYTIQITPAEFNHAIRSSNQIPIGCVIATTGYFEPTSVIITGRYIRNWKESKFYFALNIAAEAWVVALLVYVLITLRLSSKERRKQREEAILIHAIDTLVDFIEAKDEYTKGHSKRVANYTRKIAKRLKLSKDTIRDYYFTALMHDCGKISIPDSILKKKDKLTSEEYEIIKSHANTGSQMLASFTDIKDIHLGALQHHERYDGTGYPNGLKGEEISLVGRIICVADSFDVMNCDRCYRSKISKEEILEEFRNNSGTQFDPEILKVFLELLDEGQITFN